MKHYFDVAPEISYQIANLDRSGYVDNTQRMILSFDDWVQSNWLMGIRGRNVNLNSLTREYANVVDYHAIRFLSSEISGYVPSKKCVWEGRIIEVREIRTSDLYKLRDDMRLSRDLYFTYSCEYVHRVNYLDMSITSEWLVHIGQLV